MGNGFCLLSFRCNTITNKALACLVAFHSTLDLLRGLGLVACFFFFLGVYVVGFVLSFLWVGLGRFLAGLGFFFIYLWL